MGLCSSSEEEGKPGAGAFVTTEEANSKIDAGLREKYTAAGQEHVFQYADEGKLTAKQLDELISQLQGLDLDRIAQVYKDAMEHDAACTMDSSKDRQPGCCGAAESKPEDALTPLDPASTGNVSSPDFDSSKYASAGLEAIAKGEVAALVLAGGAGTRLGFDHPKGMFSIGLPSGRSLFELFAQRLLKASHLAGGSKLIPWYVMTSEGDNHAKTTKFFEDNNYFGYVDAAKAPQVFFFSQGTLPCLTDDGKIMLETGYKVGKAADGNGGIYKALQQTGQIEAMRALGVKYVHCFSVDNAIGKVADPVFMGYCISQGSDLGNKVVWKAEPGEKIGVVGKKGGKFAVIEYTEMKEADCELKDGAGKLVYGAGNICNHFYSVDFLENVTDKDLVFHIARKKIPTPSEDGQSAVKPDSNTGIKMECFIFDCFGKSQNMAVLEGARASEFSPVKNPVGSEKDSPDSARAMLTVQAKDWLQKAGCELENADGNGQVEIGAFLSYNGEGLEGLAGLKVDCSKDICFDVAAPGDTLTVEDATAQMAGSSVATLKDGSSTLSPTG